MNSERWFRRRGCGWAAAGAGAGLFALVAVLGLTALSRTASARVEISAPVVTRLPRPSATALPSPTAVPAPTEVPEAVPAAIEGSDSIGVGSIVEVYGTEGDGLRLRASPGTAASINMLAAESEVFSVSDGPVDADGRRWFYLVGLSDASRAGWAVSEYLRRVQ